MRRKKRALRDCMEALLETAAADTEWAETLREAGVEETMDNAVSLALLKKALTGDLKAFELVRDILGQKSGEAPERGRAPAARIVDDIGGE